MSSTLDALSIPIVQAPMAGGPSTPELAAAVCEAGGLGFLAAGYRTVEAMQADIKKTRSLTRQPFGINLFMPGSGPAESETVERYAGALEDEARRAGIALGVPRFDEDAFDQKLAALRANPVAIVSFTFGCPSEGVIRSLKNAGSEAWVTVTDPVEAQYAAERGASALVLQGSEAGGHRGSFVDRLDGPDFSVLALLQLVGERVPIPLVAAGGIATGRGVAAVLSAGASAAQIGTVLMRSPEAATSPVHRDMLSTSRLTAATRVFTGRLARGVVNRMMREQESNAIIAYPEVHYLTAPLRAHGRRTGDADVINLWAGQTHELAPDRPAGEIVKQLYRDAVESIRAAGARLARSTDDVDVG